jgi:hypothetical protein
VTKNQVVSVYIEREIRGYTKKNIAGGKAGYKSKRGYSEFAVDKTAFGKGLL